MTKAYILTDNLNQIEQQYLLNQSDKVTDYIELFISTDSGDIINFPRGYLTWVKYNFKGTEIKSFNEFMDIVNQNKLENLL